MIKDPDETPDEETSHRVRSGRVSSTGASDLVELGCVTVLEALGTPYFGDFYGGFITGA